MRTSKYVLPEPQKEAETAASLLANVAQRVQRIADLTRVVIEPDPPITIHFKLWSSQTQCIGFSDSRPFHLLELGGQAVTDSVTFKAADGVRVRLKFNIATATPPHPCPFFNSACRRHMKHSEHEPFCEIPPPKSPIVSPNSQQTVVGSTISQLRATCEDSSEEIVDISDLHPGIRDLESAMRSRQSAVAIDDERRTIHPRKVGTGMRPVRRERERESTANQLTAAIGAYLCGR